MQTLTQTVAKARARLVVHAPFYGSMALGMTWSEDPSVPTMATDGASILYNRVWCERIGSEKCMGVIAHEVLHVVNKHHLRRGDRDPKLWNIATDLVINTILCEAGYPLPHDLIFDHAGEFRGLCAETVYARLKARAEAQGGAGRPEQPAAQEHVLSPPSAGQNGATGTTPATSPSNGATPAADQIAGYPIPSWGEVRDFTASGRPLSEPARARAEADIDVRIRQAVAAAKRAGRFAGGLAEMVDAAGPRVDWRDRFRLLADGLIRDGITWSRPNRRFLPHGLYLPSAAKAGPGTLAVVLDTSGSISARELAAYTGELLGLIEEMRPEQVVLIQCDVVVRQVTYLTQGETLDRIEVVGRGGTRFQPAFDWIADHAPDVRAIIYETDLGCTDTPSDPGIPVIWLTPTRGRRMPFGDVMTIEL